MGSDFHRNCPEKDSCQVINNKNILQNTNSSKCKSFEVNSGKFKIFDFDLVKEDVMVSSKLRGSFV